MLGLLFLAVSAHAAPISDRKLLFPSEVSKNSSSFFDAPQQAAALARFYSVIGGPDSAALTARKADSKWQILRSFSHVQQHARPELRPDFLANRARMAARLEGAVLDRPSMADINRPIADYLYGADVMLSPEDLKRMNASIAGPRQKRGAPVITSVRWPKTQPIAFIFSSDIDESTRQLIRTSTQKIAANTCLSFAENGTVGSQLEFHRGGGCWSSIGNAIEGKQPISVDSGCERLGIIAHEISHALGLDHTQNRKDRDAYVQVNTVAVHEDKLDNFNKLTDEENDNFGVPYEYGSDMHYGAFDFSKNWDFAIVAADPDYLNTMGQRRTLTFNDYKLLNALYQCSDNCPQQMTCQNGGYTSPKDCNVCVCSDFYTGTNCEIPRTTVSITGSGKTIYHQEADQTLRDSGNNNNWDMFGKDAVKIIRAPEGRKIRVTINQIYADNGKSPCIIGCPYLGVEFVDNASGDLTTMGKIFCCRTDEGFSFVSKSHVIGYKAYVSPGMPIDAAVTYTVV